MTALDDVLGGENLYDAVVKGYMFVSSETDSIYKNHLWKTGKGYLSGDEITGENGGFRAFSLFHPNVHLAYKNYQNNGDHFFEIEQYLEKRNGQLIVSRIKIIKEIELKGLTVDYATKSARHALPNYEVMFGGDDRPRKAIETAETYFRDPSRSNRAASGAAAQAIEQIASFCSARLDTRAAGHAVRSAYSANISAAVDSVTKSVFAAAQAAEHAVRSAEHAVSQSDSKLAGSAEEKWQKGILEKLVKIYYI